MDLEQVLGEVVVYLPECAAQFIESLSLSEQLDLREIRIKADCPLLLCSGSGRRVCPGVVNKKQEIEASFRKICASSAYTHRNEIRSGFVTLPGGHRVGIVGTAVMEESGRVAGMRDIYGLSFRVAREYPVPTGDLMQKICEGERIKNLLLAGPPCSGKTTVLRALAKDLSESVQVSVVDEREELFPSSRPVPVGCDVLRGYPKATGILQALRTLSPRVIVCDEIGTAEEVSAMLNGLRSGVSLLISAHAYSPKEILQRPPVRDLFVAGGIDLAAFLDTVQVGTICNITEREDLCAEMYRVDSCIPSLRGERGGLCS